MKIYKLYLQDVTGILLIGYVFPLVLIMVIHALTHSDKLITGGIVGGFGIVMLIFGTNLVTELLKAYKQISAIKRTKKPTILVICSSFVLIANGIIYTIAPNEALLLLGTAMFAGCFSSGWYYAIYEYENRYRKARHQLAVAVNNKNELPTPKDAEVFKKYAKFNQLFFYRNQDTGEWAVLEITNRDNLIFLVILASEDTRYALREGNTLSYNSPEINPNYLWFVPSAVETVNDLWLVQNQAEFISDHR